MEVVTGNLSIMDSKRLWKVESTRVNALVSAGRLVTNEETDKSNVIVLHSLSSMKASTMSVLQSRLRSRSLLEGLMMSLSEHGRLGPDCAVVDWCF